MILTKLGEVRAIGRRGDCCAVLAIQVRVGSSVQNRLAMQISKRRGC